MELDLIEIGNAPSHASNGRQAQEPGEAARRWAHARVRQRVTLEVGGRAAVIHIGTSWHAALGAVCRAFAGQGADPGLWGAAHALACAAADQARDAHARDRAAYGARCALAVLLGAMPGVDG